MQKQNIEKLVDETLESFHDVTRAEPRPFLLTRIYARLKEKQDPSNIWTSVSEFLTRPVIAFTTLLLIIVVNASIILSNITEKDSTDALTSLSRDEFAINVVSIYDLENQEPDENTAK